MSRLWISTVACAVTVLGLRTRLAAQTPTPDTAVPVYASADGLRPMRETAIRVAALRQPIVMDFDSITLEDALQRITLKAGLGLSYARRFPQLQQRVSLHALNLTVTEALVTVITGTGLDLLAWPSGHVVLVEHGRALVRGQPSMGAVTGRVTDAVTRAPLDQVAVRVEGPGLGAVTTSDGRYAIRNVPAGTYHITARRVGYTPRTITIAVITDSTAIADFALAAAPTRLNEVVTTAVGDQRRYEVGNTISTINTDSIAPTAPITSLTDLISARAPGVTVEETNGLSGSGEAIRIRGQSSLALQGDPIVIVDGVRQNNAAGGVNTAVLSFDGSAIPSPSRLNDLDFNDIQTIDVLKGPAASTEYGTDAANGVIVITTKQGTAGRPHWHASAEETRSAIPEQFPTLYHSWGHTIDASHTSVQCPLVPFTFSGGFGSATGSCAVDSVTTWDPLNNSLYSIFGTGNRQKYDLSASGGSEAARYYVAGSVTNERGIVQMPDAFIGQARAVGLPSSVFDPNTLAQRSVRGNTAIRLGTTADLSVTGAYLSTDQKAPTPSELFLGVLGSPAIRDSAHNYGYGFSSPLVEFGRPTSQTTNRVTGGTTLAWRPLPWFVGHGTLGLDHASQRNTGAILPQIAHLYNNFPGELAVGDATIDIYTVDLRGSATVAPLADVRAVTSVGVQLADTRQQGVTALANGVTATNFTLNGAVNPIVAQLGDRQATLGGYAEEQFGIADRVFLTGALRIDAASGFGHAYNTAAYPKASLSWLAVNTRPANVRLRGAFGESGVQPPNGAALQLYAPILLLSGGAPVSSVQIANVQNQTLRPERSSEFEGGVDIGLWQNRVSIELTAYRKTTQDALVQTGAGWDGGALPYAENVGEVRNTGTEGSISATIVSARVLTWDATLNASVNHNTLVRLAPGIMSQQFNGALATYRFAPGNPLYSYWAPVVRYADLNHDGVIEPNEITIANSLSYAGASLPTREFSLGTHLGLWGGAVSVGGLMDYRGGFRLLNSAAAFQAFGAPQNDRASNDRSAPLWQQARDVGFETIFATGLDGYTTPAGFYEDGTYLRIRELSLTYAAPSTVARALRVRELSLTGAVRNLALWTRYTGMDPEVANSVGVNTQLNPSSNTNIVNNNMREDYGAVPLPRSWVVRLNVGLP